MYHMFKFRANKFFNNSFKIVDLVSSGKFCQSYIALVKICKLPTNLKENTLRGD